MKMLHSCLLLCAAILLSGCATDIGKKARGAGVSTIRVEPRIDADVPMRHGLRYEGGDLSVKLAGVIVDAMRAKKVSTLSSNMQHNAIDVRAMVREQAPALLTEKTGMSVVTNGGDAALILAIEQYGFDDAYGNSDVFIALRGELVKQGKCVWRGRGMAYPFRSGRPGAKLDELLSDRELMIRAWVPQVDYALREMFMLLNEPVPRPKTDGKR